jgi:excisionase family DNA binding protein
MNNTVDVPEPAFYTAAEAAELLRYNRVTVYRLLRSGAIPATRISAGWRIPRVALARTLAANRTGPTARS